MKRTTSIAMLIVGLMAASTGAGASTGHATKAPQLGSRLLKIGQMPTGWAVDNQPSSGVGCLASLLEPKGIRQTGTATVEFENGGVPPAVDERLATYANATAAYQKIVADLNACKRLSGTTSGQKFTGAVGRASFPRYGSASAAFEATFTIQGESLAEDIIVVRVGSIILGIDEGDYPPVDTSQFEGFIKLAVSKLS